MGPGAYTATEVNVGRRSVPAGAPHQLIWGAEVLTSYSGTTIASPDQVWRVLANGWLFGQWAIGALKVCRVDDDWPRVGSRLDHTFGRGPGEWRTETLVLASTPRQLLKVRTDGWPSGASELTVTLDSAVSGTNLRMEELTVDPGHVVPPAVRSMLLQWRSSQLIKGLAMLAESTQT